jgi:nucleotidyltransferase/DNA polymerase involved in DNA repair
VQKSFGNLDITAAEVVSELRAKIVQRTTLTASAGIAPNTFLAKVSFHFKKLRNEELCNLKTGKGGEQTSMGS